MLTVDCANTTAARSISICLSSRSPRNHERCSELPEHEVGLAVARRDRDRAVRVVDDVALSEVRRPAAVVVARTEVDASEREFVAEWNHEPAPENPGA